MDSVTLLIILLMAGSLLIGIEIFVPGAVAGTLGGIALFVAVIIAFTISAKCGLWILLGVVFLTILTVIMWVRLFPRTTMGRKMTLSEDGTAFKAGETQDSLAGKSGITLSQLRPAGYVEIDGKRLDVITEGGIIEKGQPVTVVKVIGNRIVVRKADA